MRTKTGIRCTAVVAALSGLLAIAQEAPRAPGVGQVQRPERRPGRDVERSDRGQRSSAGEFNPEQLRDRIRQFNAARIKEQLKATDDEWALIEPLIARVLEVRRELRPGGPAMGRGVPFGLPVEAGDESAVRQAADELRKALDADSAEADVIQEKLRALRAERAAVEEKLNEAQEELRSKLTVRQEARLTLMGILD